MADAPHPDLDAVLERVRAAAGARQVRVVDGRGDVLASVGEPPAGDADDPAAVARLVRDALALGAPDAAGGGVVVVSTPRAVHVLRPCADPGTFVHVRLARPGADPARAGRALDAAGLPPAPDAGGAGRPLTADRATADRATADRATADRATADRATADRATADRAGAVPAPRAEVDAQQPALAALGARRAVGLGRASTVLGEHVGAIPVQQALPRRAAAPPAPAPNQQGRAPQVWATDLDTLRRVLTGLRTLT